MVAKNALGHFTDEILRGETTSALWSLMHNAFFPRETPELAKAAMEKWAAEHGIGLSWGQLTGPPNRRDRWVHFHLPAK